MKSTRGLIAMVAVLLGFAVPVSFAASSASAAPTSSSSPSAAFPGVLSELQPIQPGATSSVVLGTHCYANVSDVKAGIAESPNTNYTIGIDYQDTNYSGTSWYYTGTSPCSSNIGCGLAVMQSGWNDDISSASSNWSNCNDWVHYENGNFNRNVPGATVDCKNNSCYYIGSAMNDRTSSETWNT